MLFLAIFIILIIYLGATEGHKKTKMLRVVFSLGGWTQIIFIFLSVLFYSSQIFYNEHFNALVIFSFKLVTLLN